MSGIIDIAKSLGVRQNVCIRVIDEPTGKVVSEHVGHNAATSTLLTGIGHFLMGEALSGGEILSDWIPQYISLGTMGLFNQEEDENGLPTGVGDLNPEDYSEEERFTDYMKKTPGFGSDGYDPSLINDRTLANGDPCFGLGPDFADRLSAETENPKTSDCELVSATFPRSAITYRRCLPESQSEIAKTIDVIFSALVSTGALKQFREPGKDYLFISEVGLWSTPDWDEEGYGLLAGYRLCPADQSNWDMSDEENRKKLKESIIRVGVNQIVQVIWKIQLGAIEQVGEPGEGGDPKWYIFV